MGIIQNFRLISSTAKIYFANKLDTQKHTYFQESCTLPYIEKLALEAILDKMDKSNLPSKFPPRNDPPPYTENNYIVVHENVERPDLETGTFTYAKLEKFPGVTNFSNCNLQVTTKVDKKLSGG